MTVMGQDDGASSTVARSLNVDHAGSVVQATDVMRRSNRGLRPSSEMIWAIGATATS
jgi:hypothetical protein